MEQKWKIRFLQEAYNRSQWSKDPSTKVGAIIVSPHQRIVSSGYNGFPHGVPDDPEMDRDLRLLLTVHAEINALLQAHESVRGYHLFCTHPPCAACTMAIIQSGIKHITYLIPDEAYALRWAEHSEVTSPALYQAMVTVEQFSWDRIKTYR